MGAMKELAGFCILSALSNMVEAPGWQLCKSASGKAMSGLGMPGCYGHPHCLVTQVLECIFPTPD